MHPDFFSYPQNTKKKNKHIHTIVPIVQWQHPPKLLILSPHKECGKIHAPKQISDALTRGSFSGTTQGPRRPASSVVGLMRGALAQGLVSR